MKRSVPALACAAALVASMAACGGVADKSELPTITGGSSPSTSATRGPSALATKAPSTATGRVALAVHSTTTYGGLIFAVNLPADIPNQARPSMTTFADFLQGIGRTMARNSVDPALSGLASAEIVKEIQAATGGESVKGIGSARFTINKVQASRTGFSQVTGCLDQSKLVQVRKDGSHFVDANAKKYPTLKMAAGINPGATGSVTRFAFVPGSC